MRTRDYYGNSHILELTMETPPKITNTLVTSYEIYEYLQKTNIEAIEKVHNIGITGIKVIPSIYCQDDYGYLFDGEGSMTTVILFNFGDDK